MKGQQTRIHSMWIKCFVIFASIISTISIVFTLDYFQKNIIASTIYMGGGNVTGRIGYKGVLPNGTNGSMKKGDSVLFNETSPEGDPLAWRLIQSGSSNASNPGSYTLDSSVFQGFTMSAGSAITYPSSTWHVLNSRTWGPVVWGTGVLYRESNVRSVLDQLNATIADNAIENALIKDRLIFQNFRTMGEGATEENFIDYTENRIFVYHTAYEVSAGYGTTVSGLGVTSADITVNDCDVYWGTIRYSNTNKQHMVTCATGTYTQPTLDVTSSHYYRFGTFLDLSNVVFAVSKGTANEIAKVKEPAYTDGSPIKNAVGDDMKLRLHDSALTVKFNSIKNQNGAVTSKIIENSKVKLSAEANSGMDIRGNPYVVSVLVFNQSDELVYYKPLESAKGTGDYMFDTSGIPIGSYKIAIVNEAYSDNDNTPAACSLISSYKNLEIVNKHTITYIGTPQEGASSGKNYEFTKNVNAGQTVGKISVNSQGVMPLTYTVESNGDNTYQNFEVDGLDTNNASSSTSLNVKIKNNAPDLVNGGLKAGTYKFCINAVDANGDPATATVDSRVCTSFTVEKTSLTAAFDDPSQTKKSISNAATVWSETATATPGSGTKITYAITGGDFCLIDIDANTGSVRYKGNGDYGKVTITATADDDPASGHDNYNPASVEKDIIIYKEVEGVVTPASGSGDNAIPTFTANQANVQANGKIAKITGMPGSPTPIDGNSYKYTYGIASGGNVSFFAVDANTGDITTKGRLSIGEYHFNVTVSDGWSTKEIAVTVKVEEANAEPLYFYETSAAINMITRKSVVLTEENVVVYATVKGSSNPNPVKYRISDGSTDVIEVNETSGAVMIHGVGTATIVAEKQGISGQANASAELEFTVTPGAQNFIYTDEAGNELPKAGGVYNAYSEVYEKDKTFRVYTAGNPAGSTVTYQLKAGSPTDVIEVDSSGEITILNASLTPSQLGKIIVQATSHDPSGNYSDTTIELPITITKATQTISFREVTYVSSGTGQVEPMINEQDISSNEGGANVPNTNYYISVDTSIDNNIAYTNDGRTIHYDYDGDEGKDIPLHVLKQGNRNYEKAEADGTLHIMGAQESELAVTNMGKIIYGDRFTISSLQDDSSSANVQYQFEVDNTTYISAPVVNGNSGQFEALKYSGSTSINIKVTRTAESEKPMSKIVSVQVLPKPIEIIIDDKEKYKGEQNPTLTYQDFRTELVSWNGVQDIIQENDIKLNTTAKTDSNAGSYPIKGDSNTLNETYPNYSFTFKGGTLTIKEENIEDDWYHLEVDDGSNTAYTGNWTNQNVNIISDHSEYINLSLDQSTWKSNQVTVTKEGETNQSFWMKKDSGAITKEKKEIIKIDKTAPKVKGIKAKDTNNKLQDIIYKLSGGIFFKPGTAFEITTDDSKDDLKVSGTKEIAYKVYKVEQQARAGDELIKEGNLTVTNEKASITISETTGKYKVCVTPSDNAGNTNTESCHELELKKINVDVDGDGKLDFNDPNGDGCPDLNIKWKDPNNPDKWIVLNGDRDYDGIPDLNVDGDGDGKPDINIDTDNDGTPDENIKEITEWKPDKNIDGGLPYDTMEFKEPQEPNNPDEPKKPEEPDHQQSNTNVKGYYYPGDNVGGAITGDETKLMLHLGYMMLGIGIISYLLYRYKKDTFQ